MVKDELKIRLVVGREEPWNFGLLFMVLELLLIMFYLNTGNCPVFCVVHHFMILVTAQRPNSSFPLDLTGTGNRTWPGACQSINFPKSNCVTLTIKRRVDRFCKHKNLRMKFDSKMMKHKFIEYFQIKELTFILF